MTDTSLAHRIEAARAAIREIAARSPADCPAAGPDWKPEMGIILGSGLGDLADEVPNAVRIPYRDIPNFPVSTVPGHSGRLVLGTLEGRQVMIYQGRVHFYEGYSMEEVTFGVRLMKALGAHTMLVTNAVGGIWDALIPGDLVVNRDHINFMGTNPLRGPNDDALGPRFPRMDDAYDADLRALAQDAARQLGITLREAVYLALTGPSYETKAEIAFFRTIGADTVGMSTVPEVIVARHSGLRVLGISCVTNALHGKYEEANHAAVVAQAKETGPRFVRLLRTIVAGLPAVTESAGVG